MKGGHLNEPDPLAKLEIATIIVCETECFFFVVEDFQVMIIYLEGNIFQSRNRRMSYKLLFNLLEKKISCTKHVVYENFIVAQSMVIHFNRLVV